MLDRAKVEEEAAAKEKHEREKREREEHEAALRARVAEEQVWR